MAKGQGTDKAWLSAGDVIRTGCSVVWGWATMLFIWGISMDSAGILNVGL